jgi:uncharacterized damage-inducible protein DinB
MHPRLQELLDHAEQHHANLLAEVERIPEELRGVRPAADRWSVAEVVEHLSIVAAGVTKQIAGRVTAAREEGGGADPDTSSVLPTVDSGRVVDRSERIVAPKSVTPGGQLDAKAASTQLETAFEAFRDVIRASDRVNLMRLSMPHRVFGEMNLYQWMAFVAVHESRHAAQIAEIGEALRSK